MINYGEVVNTVLNGGAGFSSDHSSFSFQNTLSCITITVPLLDRLACLRAHDELRKAASWLLRICFDGLVRPNLSNITVPGGRRAKSHPAWNRVCPTYCYIWGSQVTPWGLFNSLPINVETGIYQRLNNMLLSHSKHRTKWRIRFQFWVQGLCFLGGTEQKCGWVSEWSTPTRNPSTSAPSRFF